MCFDRFVRRCPTALASVWLTSCLFYGTAAQATSTPCIGDCDGDGQVTVAEIIVGVNIALGTTAISSCPRFDRDGDTTVSVDEIIVAVQNALNGCGTSTTPTPPGGTATVKPTPTASARPTTPGIANFTISGKVSLAAPNGGGISAADDAVVGASVDRNGNGTIDPGEAVSTIVDGEGEYTLALAVNDGEQAVVSFRATDAAPLFRTVPAAPDASVMVNVTLRTAEVLTCEATGCSLQGDRLSIAGLPAGVTGMAQVFNPVTQADGFPGDFADSDGNLLLSGVFASVELETPSGQPLKQLSSPATLRMQIPRETWPIIIDITPGNGRIDVPLYAFDEAAGTWIRDGAAVLEDANQAMLAENTLASIRNGTYGGTVVARGAVVHFSYWNVDWPIDSHACVGGRILAANGTPLRGASVTARGVTYTGTSPASVTDRDGRFCLDALRSENPGEDVDQDGVVGETQTISIRIVHDGRIYSGGEADTPRQTGTCDGPCADIGDLRLTPDRELRPTICTAHLNVRDRSGQPVADALVIAADDTIDPDLAFELCAQSPDGFCFPFGSSDEQGNVTVTAVVLDTLYFTAFSSTGASDNALLRWGERTYNGCPSQPLTITLTEGYRFLTLDLQFTPPSRITWTPTTYPVETLQVVGGTIKWTILASTSGFGPPVTYGVVPAGSQQILPVNNGVPPALTPGDFISVSFDALGDDGYLVLGQGVTFVP